VPQEAQEEEKVTQVRRGGLTATVAAAALVAALIGPAGAAAATQTKINEVFPGTPSAFDKAFVELKMTANGQNALSGEHVTLYNGAGTVTQNYVIPGNVPLGQSQRTILIGDIDVTNQDFSGNFGTLIPFAGGAVCLPDASPPDCVAWGNFSAPGVLSAPVGANVAPGGIPNGGTNASALLRTRISAGCATALDAPDDVNDSATEFTVTDAETPDANSAAPKTTACAVKKKCKKKKRKKGKAKNALAGASKKKQKKRCKRKKKKRK
jgi:hypothetical protein